VAEDVPARPATPSANEQRKRIYAAVAAIGREHGLDSATIENIVRRARIAPRIFYRHVGNRFSCIEQAFEEAVVEIANEIRLACDDLEPWNERVRAGVAAVLAFLDSEPDLAWLTVVGALAGGPKLLARRAEVLDQLARHIDTGRALGADPPRLTAEATLGGAVALVHARVAQPAAPELHDLVNAIVASIVLPFLGAEQAREEAMRPHPAADPTTTDRSEDTLRILAAIGACPGLADTELAQAFGDHELTRIVELTAWLRALGLAVEVPNDDRTGADSDRLGWVITRKGTRILAAAETHSDRAR
jgi:AcrR family transcriptional regulator